MIGGYYRCGRCKRIVKVYPPTPLELQADFYKLFDDREKQKEDEEVIEVRDDEYAKMEYISSSFKVGCAFCPNCNKEFESFMKEFST